MSQHTSLTAQTALFAPGDRPDRVRKALSTSADVVIIDLEDAVAESSKDHARGQVHDLLRALAEEHPSTPVDTSDREPATRARVLSRVVVRTNSPETGTGRADLQMLSDLHASALAAGPSTDGPALMVPKSEAEGILDALPRELEQVAVIALVETPSAARDVQAIADHPRADRLAIGAVDLSAALGCESRSVTIDAIRAAAVLASATAGLPAPLDSPCVDFTDPVVITDAARTAVRDGFGGMLCIHPRQLEHIDRAYAPDEADVEWARRVLAAGDGAGTIDGQMVDRPVVLRARQILRSAARAGFRAN